MQKRIGQLSVIGIALCALLAALFFVPAALGWRTATVSSFSSGTFYPQTVIASTASPAPLLSCEQTSGTTTTVSLNLGKNTNYPPTTKYFSCTNNWGAPVTFTITINNNGGTGLTLTGATLTIPPGQTKCVPASIDTKNKTGDVLYDVTASATDLSATLQFAGTVTIAGADSVQCSFP